MNVSKKYRKTYKRYPKRSAKRFSRTPMYRTLKNLDTTSVKAEYYMTVVADTTGSVVFNTLNSYLNVLTILAGSTSFTSLITDYARYKFNGMQLRFDSSMPVPNSDLTALPQPVFAFYPQSTSSSVGAAPTYNDNKFSTSPAITTPQTKYIPFPNNYFQSSSGGYGTWNNSIDYSTISGQISVSAANLLAVTSSNHILGVLRVTFYMSVSTKNQ